MRKGCEQAGTDRTFGHANTTLKRNQYLFAFSTQPQFSAHVPRRLCRSHASQSRSESVGLCLSKTSKCLSGWELYFLSEPSSDAHCSYDTPWHSVFHVPFSGGA